MAGPAVRRPAVEANRPVGPFAAGDVIVHSPDLLAGRAQALARLGDKRQAMAESGESAYWWMVCGELMLINRVPIDRHCFDKATAAATVCGWWYTGPTVRTQKARREGGRMGGGRSRRRRPI